jgi:hypothetical protein
MPDQIIDIPGVGQVAFPEGMSDDAIAEAAERLLKRSSGTVGAYAPGILERAGTAVDEVLPGNYSLGQVGRFVSDTAGNLLPSAMNVGGEMLRGGGHLAKLIGQSAVERITNNPAGPANQEFGETVIGFIPGVVRQANERYGTPEALARTVRNDPAGVIADVATLGALVPNAARTGLRTVAGSVGKGLQAGAETLYQTTLRPLSVDARVQRGIKQSAGLPPDLTAAQIGVERGVIPTPAGVARAQTDAVTRVPRVTERQSITFNKLDPKTFKLALPDKPTVPMSAELRKQLSELMKQPSVGKVRFKGIPIDALPPVPDDLLMLEDALATPPKGGLDVLGPTTAAAGYLFGGGPSGALLGYLASRLAKSPAFRGGAAIALDRVGRVLPELTEPAVGTGLAGREDDLRRQLEAELLKRSGGGR